MYPVLFQIGPVTLRTLGLFMAFAFLAATFVLIRLALKRKLNLDFFADHLISFLLVTLFVSRMFFVIINWYKYNVDFLNLLKIQDGGFSFWGGVLGFILILAYWSYRKKNTFWKWFDVSTVAALVAFALVNLGFFFSGDYYGKPSDLPWAVTFDNPEVRYTDPVHPLQIYATLAYTVIFFLLLKMAVKRRKDGFLGLMGVLFFALAAFILDFFLGDRITLFAEITLSQIISLTVFILAVIMLTVRSHVRYKKLT